MKDTIILSGIELFARGGVTEGEKQIGQRYRVNVELELDLGAAAQSDSIEDTIDYAQVYSAVAAIAARPFNLVEALTGRIVDVLLDDFPVERATVEVQKLLPPIEGVVAYEATRIARGRSD